MSTDYPGAIDMMLPTDYSFSSVAPLTIVCHQTGGDLTLDAVHNTFLQTKRSTHFAIDRDGNVAQFVPLSRGAGGNCCPDKDVNGNLLCTSFWLPFVSQYGNLNFCSISIEHCNDSSNSLPMTPAQVNASNKLIKWLCDKFQIEWTSIHSHKSINPNSKPFCPGPMFNFDQLFTYLKSGGGTMITANQQKEMDTVWLLKTDEPPFNGVPPRTGTGIHLSWEDAYLKGFRFGSATSQEYTVKDFNGVPMQVQNCENATCYWRNHTPYWYDGRGLITF